MVARVSAITRSSSTTNTRGLAEWPLVIRSQPDASDGQNKAAVQIIREFPGPGSAGDRCRISAFGVCGPEQPVWLAASFAGPECVSVVRLLLRNTWFHDNQALHSNKDTLRPVRRRRCCSHR